MAAPRIAMHFAQPSPLREAVLAISRRLEPNPLGWNQASGLCLAVPSGRKSI